MFSLQFAHVGALNFANCLVALANDSGTLHVRLHFVVEFLTALNFGVKMPIRLKQINPILKNLLQSKNLKVKIIQIAQNRFEELNQSFDRITRLADVREKQNKVFEAEQEYVEISKQRKLYQDQIDTLNSRIRSLKDKLDTTSPSSDSYLELRKYESDLSRELKALETQLSNLEWREQQSFGELSKALRQYLGQELLRQERGIKWGIISIALSASASLIALIAQIIRSQGPVLRTLESTQQDIKQIKGTLDEQASSLNELSGNLDVLRSTNETLLTVIMDSQANERKSKVASSDRGWLSYVPGVTVISALFRYIY